MKARRIRFTRHASEKFEFLKRYGFVLTEESVEDVIENPDRVEERDELTLAIKSMDDEYGLRVVYRRTNDNIVVVTFYPVRRERFNV
jgi:hypothetical protein